MINILRNGTKISFLPFIKDYFGQDKIEHLTPTEKNRDLSVSKDETGWDRIKRIFEVTEFGDISYEANSVLQSACLSIFVGALFGGTINSRNAYTEFMRNNEATTFKTQFEAKRLLQDKVTIAFGKGAFKFGWRLTLFTTSFVGIVTLIQTYRGNNGIMEYAAAGGLSGFMYKFNSGPKGWIVGGGLGSVLGLACGSITWGLLNLTGLSMEETRYWQYQWRRNRRDLEAKSIRRKWEDEDFAIIKLHDEKIGKSGRSLDNLNQKSNENDANNKVK